MIHTEYTLSVSASVSFSLFSLRILCMFHIHFCFFLFLLFYADD